MTLGAGESAAGTDFAGYAPVGPRSTRQQATPPRALSYDPATGDFGVQQASGVQLYQAIHPIDQWVILQLTIAQGSLKSAPTVGHRLYEVTRLSGTTLQRAVEDRIRLALKAKVDEGKVSILSIEVDASTPGQLKVATSYQNLVTTRRFVKQRAVRSFGSFRTAA